MAYLGFQLKQGIRSLIVDRKLAIATRKPPIPGNWKELCGFLGTAGLCQIWIPNFGLIAKPLYNSLNGLDSEPLEWTRDCLVAFDTLKEKLILAPALGLPNLQKPFKFYIHVEDWTGFTNPNSGKHPHTQSPSLKEVGSYDKEMAIMSSSSGSYLWLLPVTTVAATFYRKLRSSLWNSLLQYWS